MFLGLFNVIMKSVNINRFLFFIFSFNSLFIIIRIVNIDALSTDMEKFVRNI